MSATDIILCGQEMTDEHLATLQREADGHPYFHAAAITLTHALHTRHSADYGQAIRRTAISIPDRAALFALIEGRDFQLGVNPSPRRPSTAGADRTTSLIEHFLGTLPEEKPRRLTMADAATDYMAFLVQSEGDTPADRESPLKGQDLIDTFIDNTQGERIVLAENETAATPPSTPAPHSDDDDLAPEFFTETMARIYIKQGKFEKASKIIARLNVNYPKKNRYFADQMRFLEKLMYNQRMEKAKNKQKS